MRARALLLALFTVLASACGAHITIRSPIRVRFGRATAVPTLQLVVVLPSSPTPDATAGALTEEDSTSPSPSFTRLSPPSATTEETEVARPTATATPAPPTSFEPTTTPSLAPDRAAQSPDADGPTATPIATPPPRLPSGMGAYAVRFQQLRFSVQGEFVQIVNRGRDQDLSGWRLVSAGAASAFTFPDGYVLRQGETVTVHSGTDDVPAEPGHLQWTTERMWENVLEEALLCDAQGVVVDRWPRR